MECIFARPSLSIFEWCELVLIDAISFASLSFWISAFKSSFSVTNRIFWHEMTEWFVILNFSSVAFSRLFPWTFKFKIVFSYKFRNRILRGVFATFSMDVHNSHSRLLLKFVYSKKATKKMSKSSPSIWRLLHNFKSTVKISSIFVAFLENMNFTYTSLYS